MDILAHIEAPAGSRLADVLVGCLDEPIPVPWFEPQRELHSLVVGPAAREPDGRNEAGQRENADRHAALHVTHLPLLGA